MKKKWPFEGDSPVARARRIAGAYRQLAAVVDPAAVAEADQRFTQWGETWVAPGSPVALDDLVSAQVAGDLIGVSAAAISAARRRGRIVGVAFGKHHRYRVSDVYQLSSNVRGRRGENPTDTMTADGSTVPNDQ